MDVLSTSETMSMYRNKIKEKLVRTKAENNEDHRWENLKPIILEAAKEFLFKIENKGLVCEIMKRKTTCTD